MLHSAIEVRRKGTIHENGLFTTQLIQKGELVWKLNELTYSWKEIEGWDEERRKYFDWYGFQFGVDCYSLPEGSSREMNHSCNPNTWWGIGTNSIVARQDIQPEEEVTYDYSTCDIDLVFEMECRCGSYLCRRKITNQDYLNLKWQGQYGLNLPTHVLDAIKRNRTLY